MISKTLEAAINDQIKHELYSAYLYLSMSAWAESTGLVGSAHWLRGQAAEEQSHAMKLFEYIYDRGGRVTLQAIAQPPTEWTSLLDVFQQVQEHERKVTGLIHNLYSLALKENDYAAQIELQWFVSEQVEEEKNAAHTVEGIKMLGSSGTSLYMLDRHLGSRGKE